MKRIFRYIDVPNHKELSSKMYSFFIRHVDEGDFGWRDINVSLVKNEIPELIKAFDGVQKGLTLTGFVFVYLMPKAHSPIHIDYTKPIYRILWPVKNCENSETRFFECDRSAITKSSSWDYANGKANRTAMRVDDNNIGPLIETIRLTQPVVFDPTILHGVWPDPHSNEPRISATMFFDQPLNDLLFGKEDNH